MRRLGSFPRRPGRFRWSARAAAGSRQRTAYGEDERQTLVSLPEALVDYTARGFVGEGRGKRSVSSVRISGFTDQRINESNTPTIRWRLAAAISPSGLGAD